MLASQEVSLRNSVDKHFDLLGDGDNKKPLMKHPTWEDAPTEFETVDRDTDPETPTIESPSEPPK